jgi:hypothetical protein
VDAFADRLQDELALALHVEERRAPRALPSPRSRMKALNHPDVAEQDRRDGQLDRELVAVAMLREDLDAPVHERALAGHHEALPAFSCASR